jgi:hypothetical protein
MQLHFLLPDQNWLTNEATYPQQCCSRVEMEVMGKVCGPIEKLGEVSGPERDEAQSQKSSGPVFKILSGEVINGG